jgi:heat-inducible transcriptional repressor
MDRRKKRILQAITNDYIQTGEPVGSRTVARKCDLGVSPATIRNEMSDLEELGYLEQPHTSAGRVPSDQGYRFYVDALMDPEIVTHAERQWVRDEVSTRQRTMDQLIHQTARLLSAWTKYTSVVLAPRPSTTTIRHLHLNLLDEHHLLIVLVTDPGFVQTHIVDVFQPIDEAALGRVVESLNQRLIGRSFKDLKCDVLADLKEGLDWLRSYEETVDLLLKSLDVQGDEKVYLDGTQRIFEHPEFKDIERARIVLEFLERKEDLLATLAEMIHRVGIQVTIGHEHRREEMYGCSMVTAAYEFKGQVIGTIGIIGPTRMDYAKIVSAVDLMAQSLSDVLANFSERS